MLVLKKKFSANFPGFEIFLKQKRVIIMKYIYHIAQSLKIQFCP